MLQVSGSSLALRNNYYAVLSNTLKFKSSSSVDTFESSKNASDISFKGSPKKIFGMVYAGLACLFLYGYLNIGDSRASVACATLTGLFGLLSLSRLNKA